MVGGMPPTTSVGDLVDLLLDRLLFDGRSSSAKIRVDNGVEFISRAFDPWAVHLPGDVGIQHALHADRRCLCGIVQRPPARSMPQMHWFLSLDGATLLRPNFGGGAGRMAGASNSRSLGVGPSLAQLTRLDRELQSEALRPRAMKLCLKPRWRAAAAFRLRPAGRCAIARRQIRAPVSRAVSGPSRGPPCAARRACARDTGRVRASR